MLLSEAGLPFVRGISPDTEIEDSFTYDGYNYFIVDKAFMVRDEIIIGIEQDDENRREYKRSEGFGARNFDDIDDVITGFEDQPWNRDLDE